MKKNYLLEEKQVAVGSFVVLNAHGLHTRPSVELARCARAFKAEVTLKYQANIVNAKSLFGILTLCAVKGACIGITAQGKDAQEAVSSLIQLAKNQFNMEF